MQRGEASRCFRIECQYEYQMQLLYRLSALWLMTKRPAWPQ
jgi:hypothetical protein